MRADYREMFFAVRFLPLAALFSVAIGQQVGVSLQLLGQTIPNNSLVNLEDLLYHTYNDQPTNVNGEQTLMCVTDLVDCCELPHAVRGNWYYPDGRTVEFNTGGATFQSNRGANEVIGNQQFYGSVRLWRRYTPPERGLFRCELPDANGVNQNLYVNILFFSLVANSAFSVAIFHSGSSTAGEVYSLMCSSTLHTRNQYLPDRNIPSPTFEWFFGQNGNATLPSGLTPTATALNSDTYTSTLQFSSLNQSHAGNYTCRLGAGSLVNSAMLIVNAPPITVMVTANLNAPLTVGQTDYTLTCDVSGAERLNPTITYQWTRNGEAVPDGSSRTLNFSPLQLSHAGGYTCHVTVSSTLLSNIISVSSGSNQNIIIQIPDPLSVTLTTSSGTTVFNGADITINCTVELGPAVVESELSLLMVDAQLFKDGINIISNPTISGTTFTYTTVVNSFRRSDSGNYSCMVIIRPKPLLVYLYGTGELSNQTRLTTGVYFSLRGSNININNVIVTDIGEGNGGALLCFTDLVECCRDSDTPDGEGALGQWLYPNGAVVGTRSDGQDFYIERGPSVVRLNRKNTSSATSTTGLFCCEIPDATSTSTKICMNAVAPLSQSKQGCTSEVAIGAAVAVGTTVFIECLIGALIIVVSLLCRKRRKSTRKSVYDVKLAGENIKRGVNKDAYDLSNKMATSSNVAQGGGVRYNGYENPDNNTPATTKSATPGGEVWEDTYEPLDTLGVREDSKYVNTATATAAIQGGVREDTYYVVPDNTVDTAAIPWGGVREGVYEDPDNPRITTSLSHGVKFEPRP